MIALELRDEPVAVRTRRRRLGAWLPGLLLLAILVLGAIVRLRRLMDVPTVTDEVDEVLRALAILRGQQYPLVNDDAYIGAAFNYAMALILLVGGPSAVAPRVAVMVAGLATIWLTYALGRLVAGRWVGLLAAALLATNGLHIIINSRVAWSHAVTPLLTTATLVAFLLACERRSPGWLVASGLLLGVALQTHPTVIALVPALLIAALLQPIGRAWLSRPWPYLAGLAALLGCLNLLVYNLVLFPGKAVEEAGWYTYAYQPKRSPAELVAIWPHYLIELLRSHASIYGADPNPAVYLTQPLLLIMAVGFLVGLGRALWRRQWLLPLVMISSSLILPWFGRQFGFLPGDAARYLALLLPVGLVLIASAVIVPCAAVWQGARDVAEPLRRRSIQGASIGLGLLISLVLTGLPLAATIGFEEAYRQRDENRLADEAIAAAVDARSGPIYVDEDLKQQPLFGGGQTELALTYRLELRGIPHQSLRVPLSNAAEQLTASLPPGSVLIVSDENRPALRSMGLETLRQVSARQRGAERGYGAYRVPAR